MRRFVLVRDVDVNGVSGEGTVVWGIQYPDGYVSYRWNTRTSTTCLATSIADVEEIHGHGGATRLLWLDTEEGAQVWRLVSAAREQAPPAPVVIPAPAGTATGVAAT